MLAKVISCALIGLEGALVEVEVDIASGLPNFFVVGLPDDAVREARERVRAAVRNSGFTFPMRRIVVNLAPADLKKEGPAYDLPIAVGVLLSSGQLEADISHTLFLGELSLDGTLRHTSGILPMVALAKQMGLSNVIVPETDAREAALVGGVRIIPLPSWRIFAGCSRVGGYSLPVRRIIQRRPCVYKGTGARETSTRSCCRRRAQHGYERAARQR
jgi:magnesium chelatase family protein